MLKTKYSVMPWGSTIRSERAKSKTLVPEVTIPVAGSTTKVVLPFARRVVLPVLNIVGKLLKPPEEVPAENGDPASAVRVPSEWILNPEIVTELLSPV